MTDCAVCGLPAEVIDTFTIRDDTGRDVLHARIRCASTERHIYWEIPL